MIPSHINRPNWFSIENFINVGSAIRIMWWNRRCARRRKMHPEAPRMSVEYCNTNRAWFLHPGDEFTNSFGRWVAKESPTWFFESDICDGIAYVLADYVGEVQWREVRP